MSSALYWFTVILRSENFSQPSMSTADTDPDDDAYDFATSSGQRIQKIYRSVGDVFDLTTFAGPKIIENL